jgi:hypothetical protein
LTSIVTSTYRCKRPPRKRKPAAIEAPAVVTIDPKTRAAGKPKPEPVAPPPANDDRKPPPPAGRKSAIVTVHDRKTVLRQQQMAELMQPSGNTNSVRISGEPGSAIVTMRSQHPHLDITPEERDRRGAAADALFREMKRRVADAPGRA